MNDTLHALRIREMTLATATPSPRSASAAGRPRTPGWSRSRTSTRSTCEEDAEKRLAMLSKADNPVVNLVAERAGEIVGWAAYGPYRDGEVRTEDAELYAIYVRSGPAFGARSGQRAAAGVRRAVRGRRPRPHAPVGPQGERPRPPVLRAGGLHAPTASRNPSTWTGVDVPEVRYARGCPTDDSPLSAGSAPAPAPPPPRASGARGPRSGPAWPGRPPACPAPPHRRAPPAGADRAVAGGAARVVISAGTDSGARSRTSSRTGVQGVGDAQLVGGEGGRRARRCAGRRAGPARARRRRSAAGSRWLSSRTRDSKARRSPASPSRNAAISRAHSGCPGSMRTRRQFVRGPRSRRAGRTPPRRPDSLRTALRE